MLGALWAEDYMDYNFFGEMATVDKTQQKLKLSLLLKELLTAEVSLVTCCKANQPVQSANPSAAILIQGMMQMIITLFSLGTADAMHVDAFRGLKQHELHRVMYTGDLLRTAATLAHCDFWRVFKIARFWRYLEPPTYPKEVFGWPHFWNREAHETKINAVNWGLSRPKIFNNVFLTKKVPFLQQKSYIG